MKTVVYKMTRKDNLEYIGITIDLNKRMSAHSKHKRFLMGIKKVEILKTCDTYKEAEMLEEYYIQKFDTYNNGLNESIDGKGNHLSKNFTTYKFKFSEESRKKMSESAKKRVERDGPTIPQFSEETKKKMSKNRKGICWGEKKISDKDSIMIYESYFNDSLTFDDEFIKSKIKKSQKHNYETLKFEELKTPGGQSLTKRSLYSSYYSEIFNVHKKTIDNIIKNKGARCASY